MIVTGQSVGDQSGLSLGDLGEILKVNLIFGSFGGNCVNELNCWD